MSTAKAQDIQTLRVPLTGESVLVRPFTFDDISDVYLDWLRDPEVLQFSNQRFYVHTLESCKAYLASFNDSDNHFLAICDRMSGAMVGTITVYRTVSHGIADIGIMVGKRAVWGQGVGSEAFRLVLSALKASGVIRKITSGTLAINLGMVRIMEKSGMKNEATRRAQELLDGKPVDVVYYSTFCHD